MTHLSNPLMVTEPQLFTLFSSCFDTQEIPLSQSLATAVTLFSH